MRDKVQPAKTKSKKIIFFLVFSVGGRGEAIFFPLVKKKKYQSMFFFLANKPKGKRIFYGGDGDKKVIHKLSTCVNKKNRKKMVFIV